MCNDDALESENVNPTEDEHKVSDIECKAEASEEPVAEQEDCAAYIIR